MDHRQLTLYLNVPMLKVNVTDDIGYKIKVYTENNSEG